MLPELTEFVPATRMGIVKAPHSIVNVNKQLKKAPQEYFFISTKQQNT
jgi:hypothetical protein